MSESIVRIGDKLHIITRRLFERDIRRHFVGEVKDVSQDLCEVRGYAFVFNSATNEYKRRQDTRTRLLALGEAGLIVHKIPQEVAIESIEYRFLEKRLVITDRKDFILDINEFGPNA